jgi:hypothetical protein
MKDCLNCKYLCREGYEDYYYVCELFGEDVPDWANHPNDECCLLKSQEINKFIKLKNDFLFVGTGKFNPITFYPEFTKEDEEHNKKATKNYNAYIEVLKKRCEDRKYKIFAEEIAKGMEI